MVLQVPVSLYSRSGSAVCQCQIIIWTNVYDVLPILFQSIILSPIFAKHSYNNSVLITCHTAYHNAESFPEFSSMYMYTEFDNFDLCLLHTLISKRYFKIWFEQSVKCKMTTQIIRKQCTCSSTSATQIVFCNQNLDFQAPTTFFVFSV